MSTPAFWSNMTSSSNGPIVLPYHRRNEVIRYENEDGTLGATACPINYDELYNLKGRLLTLVDASFNDQQQRKAFKDIVWQQLQQWMTDIEEAAGYKPAQPAQTPPG